MKKKEIFIVGINGAPHRNGRCAKLLKRALKSCEKQGARTKTVHLADEIKTFYSSYYSRKTAGFIATEEEAGGIEAINNMAAPLNHMGVLTPPYSMLFYNYSSKMSRLNEWMEKDIELLGKNIVTLSEILKTSRPDWGYHKKYK